MDYKEKYLKYNKAIIFDLKIIILNTLSKIKKILIRQKILIVLLIL